MIQIRLERLIHGVHWTTLASMVGLFIAVVVTGDARFLALAFGAWIAGTALEVWLRYGLPPAPGTASEEYTTWWLLALSIVVMAAALVVVGT